MTTLLTWSSARREDRTDLAAFTCTEKRRGAKIGGWTKHHPRPWEWEVQARIRTSKPPAQPPCHMFVGRDANGIGAFVFWEELDGPAQVEFRVAAVASRYRRRGGGWADELFTVFLDEVTTKALELGVPVVQVVTWVHEENRASQRMCGRFGLRQAGQREDGYQRWGALIPVRE